jgi:hypothetical protein
LLQQATWSRDQNDILAAQMFINGNFQTQALSNTLFEKRKVISFSSEKVLAVLSRSLELENFCDWHKTKHFRPLQDIPLTWS